MSVIVASQPGKYISDSPGMGSVESKIVQRLLHLDEFIVGNSRISGPREDSFDKRYPT